MNRLSSTNAVVLDLGGPILPVEFLADMRRYTRARLEKFVLDHAEQPVVSAQIAAVAKTTGYAADDVLAAISTLEHWCDEERSAAPLMAIEEMIWKAGFEAGALRTPIYDDAFQQMRGWVGRRVPLYTFSTAPASIAPRRVVASTPASGRSRSTLPSHCGPSCHQCPSSSVS